MDFSLTEEQLLLQQSLNRFISDHCDVERHRRLSKTSQGFDLAVWRQFADLGWLAVPFSEALGGMGGNAVDLMVVGEAMGRGLLREPYLATVVTCGGFLRRAATARQQDSYLPQLIAGSSQWAFAFAEPGAGFNLAAVGCSAHPADGGYVLSGEKITVLNGHCADYLLVTARTDGDSRDQQGLSLFIVDSTLPGVSSEAFTAVDGSRGANLRFDSVALGSECLLGAAGEAYPLIESVVDESIVAMGGGGRGRHAGIAGQDR